MKPLVIYHGGGCRDGFCAAWLFHAAMPDADFHPAQYSEPPPDVTGRRVCLLDFAYPRAVMLELIGLAHSVAVLDHHATAAADLRGLAEEAACVEVPDGSEPPLVRFDMGKSGGRLAWEYLAALFPDRVPAARPWLVDYTEDRDLWRWALPQSRAVNAAVRTYPLEFPAWDDLARLDPAGLVPIGEAILRDQAVTVAAHVRHAREVVVDGHRVLCVNATTLTSEIAGELAAGRPFGVCWFQRADGKFVYSLRSQDGAVDVSEIARGFGGGGHRAAAGFELDAPLHVAGAA